MTPTDITGDAKPYDQLMGPATRWIVSNATTAPLYAVVRTEAKPGQAAFWTFDAAWEHCERLNAPILAGITGAPA